MRLKAIICMGDKDVFNPSNSVMFGFCHCCFVSYQAIYLAKSTIEGRRIALTWWTDPETEIKYVAGTGYEFHEDSKKRDVHFLFSPFANGNGHAFEWIEGEAEYQSFIFGKLIGDTGYRPMEIVAAGTCRMTLFKLVDENTLEIRGYRHREGSSKDEPDISDYLDESDGGVGTSWFTRFE